MSPHSLEHRVLSATFVVLALSLAALTVLGITLDPETHRHVFSEQGIFERISEILWVLLGLVCFTQSLWLTQSRVLLGLTAVFLAMREADWHKAFTTDSIFKSRYYLDSPAPASEKLIAAAAAILVLACLGYSLIVGLRALVRQYPHLDSWAWLVLVTGILMPALKVLDRSKSVLEEDFGIVISQNTNAIVAALEEGAESLLPVLFMIAVWLYRIARRVDAPSQQPPS